MWASRLSAARLFLYQNFQNIVVINKTKIFYQKIKNNQTVDKIAFLLVQREGFVLEFFSRQIGRGSR
jgi:hypothetical protein